MELVEILRGIIKGVCQMGFVLCRDAKAKYVDFLTKLAPQWCEQTSTNEAGAEGESNASGGSFGLKVSTMRVV